MARIINRRLFFAVILLLISIIILFGYDYYKLGKEQAIIKEVDTSKLMSKQNIENDTDSDKELTELKDGVVLLQEYMKVMACNKKVLFAAGREDMKCLYKSLDFGQTWQKIYEFNTKIQGMHITPNDILLVSTSHNKWDKNAEGKLWRSKDSGKTFKLVLEFESGTATNWNIASDKDGYVFVSEYGYKSLPNNARRIYRSNNNGLDWKIIYEPKQADGYHNHKILISNSNKNILYQSIGDEYGHQILKSEDRGNSWDIVILGIHPTSALQIDKDILWGLDNYPKSGIVKHDISKDKFNYIFTPQKPYNGSIYDMLYVNDIIYAGFTSYDYNDWPGSIFISKDKGRTWEKFIDWSNDYHIGVGFYCFNTLGRYGYVWVTLPIRKNQKIIKYQGTLRFELVNNKEHQD